MLDAPRQVLRTERRPRHRSLILSPRNLRLLSLHQRHLNLIKRHPVKPKPTRRHLPALRLRSLQPFSLKAANLPKLSLPTLLQSLSHKRTILRLRHRNPIVQRPFSRR